MRSRSSRSAKPSRTTCSKYPSSVKPSGTSKFGRWFSVPLRSTLHRSAMRTVLLMASGNSPSKVFSHLVARLQVELVAVVAEAIAIVDVARRADAEQDVVRHVIAVSQVVHVVGGDQRQAKIFGKRRQAAVDDFLVLDAVPLHLEEEVVLPQQVAKRPGRGQRPGRLVRRERLRDLALQATAEADEALGVLGQQLLVDAGLAVETLGVARRDQLDQVVPALARLGQQDQVVVVLADRARRGRAGCWARRTLRSQGSD